jgi:CMP-N,N'-diacetyllegionaminic acid synthase
MNKSKIVVFIPARGGSKSIPGKNIRPFAGKPLLAWTIELAHRLHGIDEVVVSTDDGRIEEVARKYHAKIHRRPPHLAADDSLVLDAIRDYMKDPRSGASGYRYMVMLEPTCPLRPEAAVGECIRLLLEEGYDSAATFSAAVTHPHRAWTIEDASPRPFIAGADPWLPRQSLPPAYRLNGAAYAFHIGKLLEGGRSFLFGRAGAVITEPEASVDLDTETDFILAETIMKQKQGGMS